MKYENTIIKHWYAQEQGIYSCIYKLLTMLEQCFIKDELTIY